MSIQKVSVLMPVFNKEDYLKESIESILNQTYKNFEFIIIDDGSTDRSKQIIKLFQDPRINLICNNQRLGLSASLNKGIELCNSEYIVRMDADDISLPNRLEKQILFMDSKRNIAISGSWLSLLEDRNKTIWTYPTNPNIIRCSLFFNNMLAHPTVIMRKNIIKENKLYYDITLKKSQDYDLWVRYSNFVQLSNLNEVLLKYRVTTQQLKQHLEDKQQKHPNIVRIRQLNGIGINPTNEEINTHQNICINKIPINTELFYQKAKIWFSKIKMGNKSTKMYPEPFFSLLLQKRMLSLAVNLLKYKI